LPKILELSSADSFHKSVVHARKPIVVEFYSHSCPHCIKFAPVYSQLADALDGEVRLARIDVIRNEANRTFAHSRGIHTVPTVEVFYHGRVIGNIVGYHEIKTIVSAVKEFLSKKHENIGPGTLLPHPGIKKTK
jgi:thioredoxin 1